MSWVLRRDVSSREPARCSSGVMRSLTRLRAYFLVAQPTEPRINKMLRVNKPATFIFMFKSPTGSKIIGDAEMTPHRQLWLPSSPRQPQIETGNDIPSPVSLPHGCFSNERADLCGAQNRAK